MSKKKPEFNVKKCTSCRMCVLACPVSCLALTKRGRQGKYPNLFPETVSDRCIGCGQCAKACPMGCITMVESGT